MEVFHTIYERILAERKMLEEQVNSLESQLSNLPEGKLVCTRNDNRYKWYQSDGHKSIYIPKKNRELAEELAIKKYLTLQLKDVKQEIRAIDFYLKHHSASRTQKLLDDMPEYQNLLSGFFRPMSQELSDWANSPYDKNPNYPEKLTIKARSGNMVRSKSEAMIDMILYLNKIPFRYECALVLPEGTFYPDFTICHPESGKIYYWEHFGLMDNVSYAQNAYLKLSTYSSYGIIPSVQLITTYETKENPLSPEVIQKIVEHYFL